MPTAEFAVPRHINRKCNSKAAAADIYLSFRTTQDYLLNNAKQQLKAKCYVLEFSHLKISKNSA